MTMPSGATNALRKSNDQKKSCSSFPESKKKKILQNVFIQIQWSQYMSNEWIGQELLSINLLMSEANILGLDKREARHQASSDMMNNSSEPGLGNIRVINGNSLLGDSGSNFQQISSSPGLTTFNLFLNIDHRFKYQTLNVKLLDYIRPLLFHFLDN